MFYLPSLLFDYLTVFPVKKKEEEERKKTDEAEGHSSYPTSILLPGYTQHRVTYTLGRGTLEVALYGRDVVTICNIRRVHKQQFPSPFTLFYTYKGTNSEDLYQGSVQLFSPLFC